MDIIQEVGSLSGIITNGAVITAVSTVVLAYFIWKRTRSTHPIMSRLWALFSEIKECHDTKTDEFLKQRSSLMQFRFITNIHAPTLSHVHQLIDFVKTNNIDLHQVGACGQYFDISTAKLKEKKDLPKNWHLILRALVVYVLGLFSIAFVIAGISDKMIVHFKESPTWFALDVDSANPIFSSGTLYFNQCSQDHATLARSSGFKASEVDIFCKLSKAETAKYIELNLREQRIAFAFALALSAYAAISLFFGLYNGLNALSLHKRLHPKSGDENISRMDSQTV